MQAINNEYSFAVATIATSENMSSEEVNNVVMEHEKYRAAIDAIISLDGITIEIVGVRRHSMKSKTSTALKR